MAQLDSTIAQVQALVEKLLPLLQELPPQACPHPGGRPLLGRPLEQWLAELWPQAAPAWGEAGPSRDRIRDWQQERQRRYQELLARLEHRHRLWERACRRLHQQRRRLRRREALARGEVSRAARALERLQAGLAECLELVREHEAKARDLLGWLEQVEPHHLRGFRDDRGRVVSQERLNRAQRELGRHQQAARVARARAGRLQAALAPAQGRLARTREDLSRLQERCRQEAAGLQAKAHRLEDLRRQLQAGRRRVEDLRRRELEATTLNHLYGRLLGLAGSYLDPLLVPEPDQPRTGANRLLEDSLARAGQAAARRQRWEALLQRLGRRLQQKSGRVGEVLSGLRRLNREILSLEKELPALLGPLTSPESASAQARAQAAAGLSLALARVEALLPRARRAQAELDELRRHLKLGVARGKSWQENWRRAGQEERSQRAQAQALVEDVHLQAQALKEKRSRLIQAAAPLLAVLAPLRPRDLDPALAALVCHGARLAQRAQEMQEEARRLAGRVGPAPALNLSRPPLALKPYSSALRRLGGRRVELERLEALAAAGQKWQELLSEPVVEAISRPGREVASRLAGSLALMAAERARLVRDRGRSARHLGRLARELRQERERRELAHQRLRALSRKHGRQRRELNQARAELEVTRKDQALAWELGDRLALADHAIYQLDQRLERFERLARALKGKSLEQHYLLRQARRRLEEMAGWQDRARHFQRLARALKAKSLERHRLLGQARRALAEMERWRREAREQQWTLSRTRAELDQARFEARKARRLLEQANAQRDQALQELAREREARARQALDLLEGKSLAVELAATQSEAGRWAQVARQMAAALTLAGAAHQEEVAGLRRRLDQVAAEAAELKEQLGRISQLVALAEMAGGSPEPARPLRVRITPLSSRQVDRTLDRLSQVRRRLRKLGVSTLGHWAMIAALTAGLLTVTPNTPSKATLAEAPLAAPRTRILDLDQALQMEPLFQIPARARRLPEPMGRGRLEINLLPLRSTGRPLPPQVKRRVRRLARQAGLSPKVLITSARALYQSQSAVETSALAEVARTARTLARRHPFIFRELAGRGLPPSAAALAAVDSAPERAQHLFLDRLYREYRTLGFSAEEALGALATNERATRDLARAWQPPRVYSGACRPVPGLEKMKLKDFLQRMAPYIKGRLQVFLRQRSMTYSGDLDRYARDLAFDMYCAAKKFQVPVTFLMAIAHQETWYANVLGDANRSASPFQIYEPTRLLIRESMRRQGFIPPPKKVRLERHLTLATYMAAYHLRELMQQAFTPADRRHPARVDMYKVLLRYNGSRRYPGRVAKRQKALARFLASQG